jgi:hypothetical protein
MPCGSLGFETGVLAEGPVWVVRILQQGVLARGRWIQEEAKFNAGQALLPGYREQAGKGQCWEVLEVCACVWNWLQCGVTCGWTQFNSGSLSLTPFLFQNCILPVCNPSYSGGRDQEDCSSKPARGNSSPDLISKNPSQKRTGGVAQGLGPEFKPQYHKKKKNK